MSQSPHPSDQTLQLSRPAYAQAQACIHCGLCLPACPTYVETGLEACSPRGRIHLMKSLHDGTITPTAGLIESLDLCLDCRACEPACPSGVDYHQIIEDPAIARLRADHRSTSSKNASRLTWLIRHIFPYRRRLGWTLRPVQLLQRLGLWSMMRRLASRLPAPLDRMTRMLPDELSGLKASGQEIYPAHGERKYRIGFLQGCIASNLMGPTHRKAIELLQHFGGEVIVPRGQACCGAIPHHAGDPEAARAMAEQNLAAFADCDYIVTDVAGCGAMLKDLHELFPDGSDAAQSARGFSERVRDIHEMIVAIAPLDPPHPVVAQVTCHGACHLEHAQRAGDAVRLLLSRIRGLAITELDEADRCCGAAGTYNLAQPAMADSLAKRKLTRIEATGCQKVLSANLGCTLHLRAAARELNQPVELLHPLDLIHAAYLGASEEGA